MAARIGPLNLAAASRALKGAGLVVAAAGTLVFGCSTLLGCGISPAASPGVDRGQRLRAADFSSASPDAGAGERHTAFEFTNPAPPPDTLPAQPPTVTVSTAANEGVGEVVATPGPPLLEGTPRPVGPPVLIDAKVGDVNGRAIYASSFFEPMADRLAVKARELPAAQWRAFALQEISRELNTIIEDELLRAEALETLFATPEQKQSLFAYMDRLSQQTMSEQGGSRERANREMQATKGQTLDQYLRDREQVELINYHIWTKVNRRVNISWRDIRQAYDRYFVKAEKATFHLVRIPADQPADIEAFRASLGAGTSFAQASAAMAGNANIRVSVEDRDLKDEQSKGQFFGDKDLNMAAQVLAPGETAGPIALSTGSVAWLYMDKVASQSEPIYVAQLAIEDGLRRMRSAILRERHLERLRSRASITSTEEMSRRLLAVAEERFLAAAR